MKKFLSLLFFLTLFLLFPDNAFSKLGVGVGVGKIQVDDDLKPGMIYKLPHLTVLNTGDENSDYEVVIAYHQDQPELAPPQEWFSFSPQAFSLEPGQVQIVEIKLNLPLKTVPGDYFAYLEGHPTKKAGPGITTIGIAAAAKLYFTVVPANFIQGIYYKILSFWEIYAPWTNIVAIGLGLIFSIILFRKFFNLQINVAKKTKNKDE
ncbi:hypothetical protein KKE45_00630 [Patescibacteria group bacterium]|nr:hypothetical protein [Patescibacteria group bacterium]